MPLDIDSDLPSRETPKTQQECCESVPGAELTFIRTDSDCLWVLSPSRFVRWYRSKPGKDLWERAYVWDFGDRVFEVKPMFHMLRDLLIANVSRSRSAFSRAELEEGLAVFSDIPPKATLEDEEYVFERILGPHERTVVAVAASNVFRGASLTVDTSCYLDVSIWGLKLGTFEQLNRKGRKIPWAGVCFVHWHGIPIDYKFDTCSPGELMHLDVENVTDHSIDFKAVLRGKKLVPVPADANKNS